MFVSIKTLTSKSIFLEIDPTATIADLKDKISEKHGFSPEIQKLVLCGKAMDNDRTINSYNVQKETVIFLVLDETKIQNTPNVAE